MAAARGIDLRTPGIGLVFVLVELQPKVIQRKGAVVGVGDGHPSDDLVEAGVQRCLDVIIGAVLPVGRAGRSERGTGRLGERLK